MRVLVLLAALLVSGCSGLAQDVRDDVVAARDGAMAVANDAASSEQERETALTCADVLWAVLYSEGEVSSIPPPVRARIDARRAARAGVASVGSR